MDDPAEKISPRYIRFGLVKSIKVGIGRLADIRVPVMVKDASSLISSLACFCAFSDEVLLMFLIQSLTDSISDWKNCDLRI